MPKMLKNLKIQTLGSVDTPANQHGQALLFKRAEGGTINNPQPVTLHKGQTVVPTGKINEFISNLSKMLKSFTSAEQPEVTAEPTRLQKAAKDLNTVLSQEIVWDIVYDYLWDLNYAFRESIESILVDTELEDKRAAIQIVQGQYLEALEATNIFELTTTNSFAKRNIPVNDMLKEMSAGGELPSEVQDVLKSVKIEVKKGGEPMGAENTNQPTATPSVEDILKTNTNLPEDVRKALEDAAELKKSVTNLQDSLEIEKAARLDREYLSKAAELPNLPGVEQKDLADILKGIATKAPEEAEKLMTVLKSANEAIVKGALFSEAGTDVGKAYEGTAKEEVHKRAGELVSKSASGLTQEAAIAQVVAADPELYDRYQKGL